MGKMRDIINALGKDLSNGELEAHGKKLKKKRDADAHKQHSDRLKKMGMHEESLNENIDVNGIGAQLIDSLNNATGYDDFDLEGVDVSKREDEYTFTLGHPAGVQVEVVISWKDDGSASKPVWKGTMWSDYMAGEPLFHYRVDWDSINIDSLFDDEAGYMIASEVENQMMDEGVKEEQLEEAPTMDTTQLVTMLKNAGLTEEAIQEKLNEWGNTPEGVGEVEPTEHGDAYDYAEGVNLSLKRYLDAQDMKVGIAEHKVEDMKALYEEFKSQQLEEGESCCEECGEEPCVCESGCNESVEEDLDEAVIDMGPEEMPELEPEMDMEMPTEPDLGDMAPELDAGPEMGMGDMEPAMDIPSTEPAGGREETKADLEVMALRKLAGLEGTSL